MRVPTVRYPFLSTVITLSVKLLYADVVGPYGGSRGTQMIVLNLFDQSRLIINFFEDAETGFMLLVMLSLLNHELKMADHTV